MRFINLLWPVNLDCEVLDANAVVAMGGTVGWAQADPAEVLQVRVGLAGLLSHEVDDLLRASVGRIPDLLGPSERSE